MGLFERFKKPKFENMTLGEKLDFVDNLDDQKKLVNIAKDRDEYSKIQLFAFSKISGEDDIRDALDSSHLKHNPEAISLITNQNILEELAKTEFHPSALCAVMGNLKNQEILCDFAKNNKEAKVREAATSSITDENVLKDIALNDENEYVRAMAAMKIHDCGVLVEIVEHEASMGSSECSNDYVIRKIAKYTDNEDALKYIAKSYGCWIPRCDAIERITDREFLNDLLNESEGRIKKEIESRLRII